MAKKFTNQIDEMKHYIIAATSQSTLTENQDINQMSEDEQIRLVQIMGWEFENIINPSERVQLAAVQNYGDLIRYIENPSEQVQLAAVRKNGDAIRYIENPSEAVQLAAVQENAWAIEDIPDPSERVQLAAIQKSSFTINYIKNPTLKVQEALILAYPDHIRSIENPDPALFANNQIKQSIIRLLLVYLTKGIHVFGIISYLRQNQVTWPELDIIEDSVSRKPINEHAKYIKYIPTVADKLEMIKEELMEKVNVAETKGYNFKKSHVGKILKTMLDHVDRSNQLDPQVFDIIDRMMSNLADTDGGYSSEMQRRMDFFSGIGELIHDLWNNASVYFN